MTRPVVFTPARDLELRRLFRAGARLYDIAQALSRAERLPRVTECMAARRLARLGEKRSRAAIVALATETKSTRWTADRRSLAERRWREGVETTDIAAECNKLRGLLVTPEHVTGLMSQKLRVKRPEGFRRRSISHAHPERHPFNAQRDHKLREMWGEFHNTSSVLAAVNAIPGCRPVTMKQLQNRAHFMGWPRPPGFASWCKRRENRNVEQ